MLWHKSLWWFHPLISPSLPPQSFNLQLKTAMFLISMSVNITLDKNTLFILCTTGCCHQIELMLVSITAQNPISQDFALKAFCFTVPRGILILDLVF